MTKYSRLYKVLAIFKAYRLGELLPEHHLSVKFKAGLTCLFWVRSKAKHEQVGERLRLALQELGPIWIKFGQMLSTRRDILSPDVANQLTQLQDNVEPFDGKLAQTLIEEALGKPLADVFSNFNLTPLASASIAQVHAAKMKSSKADVVIKIRRPDILLLIKADIELMYFIAQQLLVWFKDAGKLRATEVVQDYERTIYKELNFVQEAENTRRLRSNFINSDILYIPYVYPEFSRETLLVEERVWGVPISDMDQLRQYNIDYKLLAERGVQAFFTQVFRDNFFHADMHPGNIFVDVTNPQDPRYIGIDCAVVGELTKEDQRYLAKNFMAFFNQDYRKIAELYIDSGWVAEDTDIAAFEAAMQEVCEPVFAKPLGEISFAQVLFSLFHVARQFNMQVQPQLILLEKTLFYIEGLGRQLYPQLDLWVTAKPFLEGWYKEQKSIKYMVKQVVNNGPAWVELLPELPNRINQQERANRLLKSKLDQLSLQLYTSQKKQRNQFYLLIGTVIAIAVLLFIVL